MSTFPRKLVDRYDALAYMWFSGGVSFRLLLVLSSILVGTAALAGVPLPGIVSLVLISILCAGLEIANTVLEILLDLLRPHHDLHIKHLKDLSGTLPALAMVANVLMWAYLVFGV